MFFDTAPTYGGSRTHFDQTAKQMLRAGYCAVTESETEWLTAPAPDPPVAVTTRTYEGEAGVVVVVLLEDEPPPPHPETTPSKITTISILRNVDRQRRVQPRTKTNAKPTPQAEPANKLLRELAADPEAMLMVKAVVCGVNPSRLRVAGWKLHEVPEGCPEQEKVIVPARPIPGPGLTRIFAVPGVDAETVTLPGFTAI